MPGRKLCAREQYWYSCMEPLLQLFTGVKNDGRCTRYGPFFIETKKHNSFTKKLIKKHISEYL
jgi:hypothetical protein